MAQQLSTVARGASVRLVPLAVALLVLTLGGLTSWFGTQGTAYVSPFHSYLAASSGPVGLTLPLALALVAGWHLRSCLTDGFLEATRTRAPVTVTLRRLCWPWAVVAGLAAALLPVVYGLVTLELLPSTGFQYYPDAYHVAEQHVADWNADAVAGGALTRRTPWAYVAAHSAWLGLWGLVLAAATQALLLLVRRHALAFFLPLAGVTVVSVVLALAKLETFTPTASQFPPTLDVFPLWHTVPSLALAAGVTAVLWMCVLVRLPELPR